VKDIKQKWGIIDDDIYNFDETGFMMGKILSQMVITGWDRSGKKKRVQPGNREWVTIIEGVGAAGRVLPPFVVFAGKVLINTWIEDLPGNWILEVSPNGWTNNQLANVLHGRVDHTPEWITFAKPPPKHYPPPFIL